jgi:hypothetical protein
MFAKVCCPLAPEITKSRFSQKVDLFSFESSVVFTTTASILNPERGREIHEFCAKKKCPHPLEQIFVHT